MSLQKTEAIVLRSIKQGETSKILHIYTRALGKMSVIAKGARSFKSRFGGTLEPMNHISVQLYLKENRGLQFLSQAEILHSFDRIRKNLEKMATASAVCELVNRFGQEAEPNPRLFFLSLDALRAIDESKDNGLNIVRAFQVRLITLVGFHADFSKCLKCREPATATVHFSIPDGGFFCAGCPGAKSEGFPLTNETITALSEFQQHSFTDFKAPPFVMNSQLDAFLGAYFRYHVEGFGDLRSLKFYKKLF